MNYAITKINNQQLYYVYFIFRTWSNTIIVAIVMI